jgi:hypothetical protein
VRGLIGLLICSVFIGLSAFAEAPKSSALTLEKVEHNITAQRLVGTWVMDEPATERLTGEKRKPNEGWVIEFASDLSMLSKVPAKHVQKFKEMQLKFYLAGHLTLTRGDKPKTPLTVPFMLTSLFGNPHIVMWFERDGDPYGNIESSMLLLVKAKDTANDLLFLGGDTSNDKFQAFTRKSK